MIKKTKIPLGIGDTMGSSTGESENAVVAGGWAGTDDATSTALSDQLGNPPVSESEKPYLEIEHDLEATIEIEEALLTEQQINADVEDELEEMAQKSPSPTLH